MRLFVGTRIIFLMVFYSMLAACSSEEPETRGYCVEFESTDVNGQPDNTYFAYNVKTFQEAKDLLDNRVGGGINDLISPGSCEQNSGFCTQQWNPVCAITTSGSGDAPPATYGNLCLLKAAVKKLSGDNSKAKASFETGACKT